MSLVDNLELCLIGGTDPLGVVFMQIFDTIRIALNELKLAPPPPLEEVIMYKTCLGSKLLGMIMAGHGLAISPIRDVQRRVGGTMQLVAESCLPGSCIVTMCSASRSVHPSCSSSFSFLRLLKSEAQNISVDIL